MLIKRINKVSEIPPRSYQLRESPERKLLVKQAAKALGDCRVGQHVLFEGTEDRTLLANWVRKAREVKPGRVFTIVRLGTEKFGAWRTH